MVRLVAESAAAVRALTVTLTAACQKHQQQRAAVVHSGAVAADMSLSAVGAAAACTLLRLRKGTTAGGDDMMDTDAPSTYATAMAIGSRDVPLLLSCGW